MNKIPEDFTHIESHKNEITKHINSMFLKSQDIDEKSEKEPEKNEEEEHKEMGENTKEAIKNFIKTHPYLDDEEFHSFAEKMGIDKHEAEEVVYQLLNEIYSDDNLNKLKGGKAEGMTAQDIANKHNIPLQELQKQINIGVKIEREHTNNEQKALEITLDHLFEDAKYYTDPKPKDWAEKEIEKEEEATEKSIDDLLLTKALPPREGEIREYKDGKYKFIGGHWKKIKWEEQYTEKEKENATTVYNWLKKHNMLATNFELNQAAESAVKSGILTPKERELIKKKFEEEPKEDVKLDWKKNVEGDYEAYKDNISFYIYHPDSNYYLKINDKNIVKGTLEVCKAVAIDFLKNKSEKSKPTEKDITFDDIKNISDEQLLSWAGFSSKKDFEDSCDCNYSKKELFEQNYNDLNENYKKLYKELKGNMQNLKPVAKVIGKDGNVFNLIGICMKALKRAGQPEKAKEMQEKIFAAGSYEEALNIMGEYCDLQ